MSKIKGARNKLRLHALHEKIPMNTRLNGKCGEKQGGFEKRGKEFQYKE